MRTREGTALPTQTECTICLSNESQDIGLLKCKHTFCFPCIESWSEHENSCPLCKVRFTFIDRVQTSANGKPEKTRVKSKKRNQADYDSRHPSQSASSHGDDIATWTNFIMGMVGQDVRSYFGHAQIERNNAYSVHHNRNGATVRALPQASRGGGLGDFIAAARLHYTAPRRTASAPRRTHGTENNPIELSDDENTSATIARGGSSSSSSNGALIRAAVPSSSSTVVDLIDLTDDADYAPSSSSTTAPGPHAARPLGIPVPAHFHTHTYTHAHAHAAASHTAPPLHPAAAMSSFGGNYNLMDFLSDEEDDEDYEPPRFDEDAELDDDRSELSEETPTTVNEVIELPDSDDDVMVRSSAAAGGGGATARLSGIMVWCHECDSYHDTQRVRDDVSYCPSTYASLASTEGFADVRQSASSSAGASSSGAASSALRSEAVGATIPRADSRIPLVGYAHSLRVVEDTEWTSDDSTSSGQWRSRRSSAPRARNSSSASATRAVATSSADDDEEAEFEAESDLARTMSDATTASSRSRASQAATQAMPEEVRTQSSDPGGLPQAMISATTTQSSSSGSAKTTAKRSNWLAYLEEEEEAAEALEKRRRTGSVSDVEER